MRTAPNPLPVLNPNAAAMLRAKFDEARSSVEISKSTARGLLGHIEAHERLREAAEAVYNRWAGGEPIEQEMRDLGAALGMELDPA